MSARPLLKRLSALALFGQAQQGLEAPFGMLQIAEEAIRDYRAYLVGKASATGPPAGVPNTKKADQARPPGTVVPGAGQKTHGRWIDPDGNIHAEVSGKDDKSREALRFFKEEIKSRRVPLNVDHVELKLAAHMRRHRIRSAVLVINNIPCGNDDSIPRMGCHDLVPRPCS